MNPKIKKTAIEMLKIQKIIDQNQEKFDKLALKKINLENEDLILFFRQQNMPLEEFYKQHKPKGADKTDEKIENN